MRNFTCFSVIWNILQLLITCPNLTWLKVCTETKVSDKLFLEKSVYKKKEFHDGEEMNKDSKIHQGTFFFKYMKQFSRKHINDILKSP